MARNRHNWDNANVNALNAEKWVKYCIDNFLAFIKSSIENSKIYTVGNIPQDISEKRYESTTLSYWNTDTVSAIEKAWDNTPADQCKIAALNFASYKNPGGGYLAGATAQEECLCSESTLYPVIESFYETFYKPHLKKLNGGLYGDDLIYSPSILFIRNNKRMQSDVITCAAPNYYPIKKYNKFEYKDVVLAMFSRIDHILYSAWKEKADILILGAFGCGVFMNDPVIVSQIFHLFLASKYNGCFKEVIFAVPTIRDDNTFEIFKESGEIMLTHLENSKTMEETHDKIPELIKYLI